MYPKMKDLYENRKKTRKENRNRILKILASVDMLSATRLRRACGLSSPVFANHIKTLRDREKIIGTRTDKNDHRKRYYFLKEKGYKDEAVVEEIRRLSLLEHLAPKFEEYTKTRNKETLEIEVGKTFLTLAKDHFKIFEVVPQLIKIYGYPEDEKIKRKIGFDSSEIENLIKRIREHKEEFARLSGEDSSKNY